MRAAAPALAILLGAASAEAQEVVDVELVLAVDVSWSMDADEQALQRAGYAAAFRDEAVRRAIVQGVHGRIAVTYFEWAGTGLQDIVAPWTLIEDAAGAEAFASALDAAPPGRMSRTSISGALAAGQTMFAGNGFEGERRVIDVSGDGPNNQGRPVTDARDETVARGITVNGLPLELKEPDLRYGIRDIATYYEDCVIGGPNAFIVTVRDPNDFARAIRQKLILEIAGGAARAEPVQFSLDNVEPRAPRVDCLVGEKLWRMRRGFDDDF